MGKKVDLLKTRQSLFLSYVSKWGSLVFAVATAVLTFISLDDIGIYSIALKLAILAITAAVALAIAARATVKSSERFIWGRGNRKISACYGDILEIAAAEEDSICVIPVNTAFDVKVDQPNTVDKPLVSPNSLHGKWVDLMKAKGATEHDIEGLVKQGLSKQQPIRTLDRSMKTRGMLQEYAIGTVCPVRYAGMSFLLVAFSQFDQNNVAHSTRDDFMRTLEAAFDYHNRNGQGCELLIPLMGTALSRTKLSHQDSFDKIVAFSVLNSDRMNGSVRVVVFDGDADKVSIWRDIG